jgi:8-oxo-dGTP pyrophosphatase MutT (NUDIX family)
VIGPDLGGVRLAVARGARSIEPGGARAASVAMVLDDALDVVLIRRAEHPGDPWSGHLGLPGGRVEPDDADRQHTAVRETWEELGLDLSAAVAFGPLDDVASPARGPRAVVVRPFVFHVPVLPPLRPNEEVADVLRIGLAPLLSGVGRTRFLLEWRGRRITLPAVDVYGHRLWGMTLRVVDDLLHRIDGRGMGLERPSS